LKCDYPGTDPGLALPVNVGRGIFSGRVRRSGLLPLAKLFAEGGESIRLRGVRGITPPDSGKALNGVLTLLDSLPIRNRAALGMR